MMALRYLAQFAYTNKWADNNVIVMWAPCCSDLSVYLASFTISSQFIMKLYTIYYLENE